MTERFTAVDKALYNCLVLKVLNELWMAEWMGTLSILVSKTENEIFIKYLKPEKKAGKNDKLSRSQLYN